MPLILFSHVLQIPNLKLDVYRCDSRFVVEPLLEMLEDAPIYGFIIVDGNEVLYATKKGPHVSTLHRFSEDLPNRHKKGGQSAPRFQRLREERKDAYVSKICEVAAKMFIRTNECIPYISGLIVAGYGTTKNCVEAALDKQLAKLVIGTIVLSDSGKKGLQQAIDESISLIQTATNAPATTALTQFFEEVKNNTGRVVYGYKDVNRCIELGLVKMLLVSKKNEHYLEQTPCIACTIHYFENTTEQTALFEGFGGIAALLHYAVDESVYA